MVQKLSMFHTFIAGPTERPSEDFEQNAASRKRQSPKTRACEPCRRRKAKCSGELPCEACQWYHKPEQCRYRETSPRVTTNRRANEKAMHSLLQQYRTIFSKLLPNSVPEQLMELSREDLLDLVTKDSPRRLVLPSSPLSSTAHSTPPQVHPDAGNLETFQPIPEESCNVSSQISNRALRGVQDDMNALSLSVKQTSLYLGISSVMAVLRVIVWLDPAAHAAFRKTPEDIVLSSREGTMPSTPKHDDNQDTHIDIASSSYWDEIPQINAYFTFFHPMVPLLDEQSFRDTYITRHRSDHRWLLLMNTVLALGSAIAQTADNTVHRIYYARARRFLTLETLGSAHLETVQALTLLGGYYMHYLQLPNQANSLMGITMRLATALGLHRDYSENVASASKKQAVSTTEIRRRIWWCICLLDSWASITLGRPSMGRVGHAITVSIPQQSIGNSTQVLTLLQENIAFAMISTRAEDALACSPMIDDSERKVLDNAYLDWFNKSITHSSTPRPANMTESIGVSVMKSIMRWRYLWNRVVLHRPALIWHAIRGVAFSKLSEERQVTIKLCRDLAGELIGDISASWAGRNRCVMSAWHATWLLYQATMVPLLSLYASSDDQVIRNKSHDDIQMSLQVLSDQIEYSHTAKRCLEVVTLLYEAGKNYRLSCDRGTSGTVAKKDATIASQSNAPPARPQTVDVRWANQFGLTGTLDTPDQEMIVDSMFDSLNWSTGWGDENTGFVDAENFEFTAEYYLSATELQDDQHFASMTFLQPNLGLD